MTIKFNAITTGAGGVEITSDSSGEIEFQSGGVSVMTVTPVGVTMDQGMLFDGAVNVSGGGTGATTANGGFNNLAPSQSGNSGKYLTTDGTNTSWASVVSALSGEVKAIATNLTGAYTIPASGTVDGSGFMYCDGSAIPAGKALSGNVPDLTDGRFLRGSSSSGSTGGADTFTLEEGNLPSHTHTFSGSTSSAGSHNHSGSTNTTGNHNHLVGNNSGGGNQLGYAIGNIGRHGDANYWNTYNNPVYTNTVGTHSHSLTINSNGAHTHTLTGTIGSTGSGTAVTHLPKYVDVQYIIKVD